ncbi:unnamed protein product [Cuscuta epithymum]|uniref:BED-type domain-containing protein n=1 Tax=Cuscuta epithymum TaxID=186058 RepID=A0AAV0EFV8_9ASTE|nr:unnamed protein product [Cuscuta epithymum]
MSPDQSGSSAPIRDSSPSQMRSMEDHNIEREAHNSEGGDQSNTNQFTLKGKKLKSDVWDDMDRDVLDDGVIRATCHHCKKTLTANSKSGTSHLKRHLSQCASRKYNNLKSYCIVGGGGDSQLECGTKIGNTMSLNRPLPTTSAIREAMSVFFVSCALPFSLVEAPGFKHFMSVIAPQFQQVSRMTIKRDAVSNYKTHKAIVAQELDSAPGRICFTTDNWRSEHTSDEFMCVTAHWIDKSWKLQKRIIKFAALPPSLDGSSLADEILLCFGEWKIGDKVFSFTVDNASYNDTMMTSLKRHLLRKNTLLMNGKFVHIRCSCHIINLVVQAGLKLIDDCILKIRKMVTHLKHSMPKNKKFYEIASTTFSLNTTKKLRLDTPIRWNSTFTMLDRFLYFRDAIDSFVSKNVDLKCYRLTEEEWTKVGQLKKFLQVFFDVTNDFSASKTPTSNIYFCGVWKIHKLLKKTAAAPPSILSNMVSEMQLKFQKYWEDYNLILSCAAVFDPRLKLDGVGFLYKKLLGEESGDVFVHKIKTTLVELLDEYKGAFGEVGESGQNTSSSHFNSSMLQSEFDSGSDEEDLYQFMSKKRKAEIKSELDLYLDEKPLNMKDDVNVLQFWKRNSSRFVILSSLARDILSLPVSTVPSESAFSLGKKIITPSRSSLSPTTVEALACYEDWLRAAGFEPAP